MKGASAALTAILLLLVAVAASFMFFGFMGRLESNIVAEGEKQMIELNIPPKLVSLVCYDGYAYMLLSLSQGQGTVHGSLYYEVELDTGRKVADGFIETTLQDTTRVYIPYLFDTDERYLVTLGGDKWKIDSYCRPVNDPYLVFNLPLDDGSGTTASDTSDYENDCNMTDASWVYGHTGRAVELDGNSSYIYCNDPEILQAAEPTITALFKTSSNKTNMMIYRWRLYGIHLRLSKDENSTGLVSFGICNESAWCPYVISPQPYNDSSWHFVSASYNGSYMALYIDGETVNTSLSGEEIYYGSGGAAVGKDGDGGGGHFNGTIDEVRLYSRALDVDEIDALYEAYMGGEG